MQTTPVSRFPQSAARFAPAGSRHATAAAVLSLLCFVSIPAILLQAEVQLKDQPHLRRPIAGAWLVEGKLLAVANQRSGSLSILDIEKRKVLAEVVVGERLADVAALPSNGWLLAVDERRHELLLLQWEAGELQVVERIPVSRYPVNIAISADASRCTVASLWSRTITTFEIKHAAGPPSPAVTKAERVDAELRAARTALSTRRRTRFGGRRVYRPNGRARRYRTKCGQNRRQACRPNLWNGAEH